MRIKTTSAVLLNGFQVPCPLGSVVEVLAEDGAAYINVGYAKETTEEVNWPPTDEAALDAVADLEDANVAERNQAAGKNSVENLTPAEADAKPAAAKADKQK